MIAFWVLQIFCCLLCFVLFVISCILPGLNMPVNHDCVINKFDVHFDGHDGVKLKINQLTFICKLVLICCWYSLSMSVVMCVVLILICHLMLKKK